MSGESSAWLILNIGSTIILVKDGFWYNNNLFLLIVHEEFIQVGFV